MIIDPRMTARIDVTAEQLAANRAGYERDLITQLRNATAALGAQTDPLVAVCGLAQVPASPDGRTPFLAQWTGRDAADLLGGPHDGQSQALDAGATTLTVDGVAYRRAGINDATGNWAFVPADA